MSRESHVGVVRVRPGERRTTVDAGAASTGATASTIGKVTSADATAIGYRSLGQGPGAVVLHGTMSSGYNHLELAEALAEDFTVYLPDRRGRGLSGPFGAGYRLAREVEDVDALLVATGARAIIGVSTGWIIALAAASRQPAIDRVAAFEPPLFADDGVPRAVLSRVDAEMANGNVAAALVTAMRGAEMGPAVFRAMPRWLTERLTAMMLRREDAKGSGGYVSMRDLAPTIHYDFQLVAECSGRLDGLANDRAKVLLLGGSKSPGYLKDALDSLARVLPSAERQVLPGLDHAAAWNTDRGGRPRPVAEALRRFLG